MTGIIHYILILSEFSTKHFTVNFWNVVFLSSGMLLECIVVCCSNSACVHFVNKICVISFVDEAPNMDETIRQANIEIQGENRNLQALNTSLHEKYHTISLKVRVLDEFS